MEQEHPFEIRERRFRLQQRIAEAEDGPDKQALEEQLRLIQETCPHAHPEENPEKGWRCRDCDLTKPLEKTPDETETEAEEQAEEEAAESAA